MVCSTLLQFASKLKKTELDGRMANRQKSGDMKRTTVKFVMKTNKTSGIFHAKHKESE